MVNTADNTYVATFARPEVTQSSLESFEQKFADGKAWHDDFCAIVTRSFGDKSIDELAELCCQHFESGSNPFYPDFFIVLDDRTNKDGSVLLYHRRVQAVAPEELRVSPASLPALLSVVNVGMRDIPYIIANEAPDDPEELATWFHDVPVDNSDTHKTARVPVQQSSVTRVNDHFNKVNISADRAAAAGVPEVPIELNWFGDVGPSVLLFSCWEKKSPENKVVMGQI